MFSNKSILITGGTGSFGSSFVSFLNRKFKFRRIIIYSRDEQKQHFLMQRFKKSNFRFFIGDVRDLDRLKFAMRDVDIVIHAAALKHIDLAEYNPFEVVKTNILGAQNVIYAALDNKVEKVIALSTDKASSPINLYGATKLTSDKLFTSANNFKGKIRTIFSVVRYGNVMGSRGSVIPIFLDQIKKSHFLITDLKMTRFNITLDESVNFVIKCLNMMIGGELFVPKLPSYKLLDLVYAIKKNAKIKVLGIRPGEKLHEEMISSSDSVNCLEFDNFFIIKPHKFEEKEWDVKKFMIKNRLRNFKNFKKDFSYNSFNNNHYLTREEITKLIKKNVLGGDILN